MVIHARLSEPLDLRKDVLESAILVTDAIRAFDNITELGKQRLQMRKQINGGMKELKKDVKELINQLPKLPKDERVTITRDQIRNVISKEGDVERVNKLGGEIKTVESVREDVKNLTKADLIKIRKKITTADERDKLKKELASIRGRISRLHRLLPEDFEG
tara:strand:+ start:1222 stop:1704 length:483 start_codon:yes stop_codon:yes gene_type:complete